MKRSAPLVRTAPMARGSIPLRRTAMKKSRPKKRAGHDPRMLQACRGEICWLAIPGVCRGDIATVVPAHRNEGKGMGLKVADALTVPACMHCHAEYDQGHYLTRDEKRALWNAAFARWAPAREAKLNATPAAQIAGSKTATSSGLPSLGGRRNQEQ